MESLGRREFIIASGLTIGAGAAGCIDAARQTEWSKFRGTGDNQASTREHPGRDLTVGWEIDIADQFNVAPEKVTVASPIGDSETMYIASRVDLEDEEDAIATGVMAIDVDTGSLEWSRLYEQLEPLAEAYAYPPVLWDEFLLTIHGHSGTVFDRDTGAVAFEFDLPWVPQTVPGGDRALVAVGGDLVAMIDMDEDQDVRWSLDGDGDTITPINPLTVLDDRVYVPIQDRLITLRRGDGEQISTQSLAEDGRSVRMTPPIVDAFYMHLRLRGDDGVEELLAINRSDRSELWRETLTDTTGGVDHLQSYRGGRLYVTHGQNLSCYHVGNGDREFTQGVDIEAPYPTVGGDDVYLLGDEELVVVDRHDGELIQRLSLPGTARDLPQEAIPRTGALVIARGDRVIGLQSG